MQQILYLLILGGTIALFMTRALPYEATALLTIGALAASGILTPQEAFSGFSNSATITIGAMFVLSAMLIRTGALEALVRLLERGARRGLFVLLGLLGAVIGLASAFMNNTPVVVLAIPIGLSLARQGGVPPSKLMLPISYFSILGGTCTLLGTSTNLLVDGIYRSHGGPGFHIFDVTPLGLCYFLIGATYILFAHRRMLPERGPLTSLLPADRGATFVTELTVGPQASLVGRPLRDVFPPDRPRVHLLEIVRGEHVIFAGGAQGESVVSGDSLIVEGAPQEIAEFIRRHELEIATVVEDDQRVEVRSMDLAIAEAVVLPDSPFVGRTVATLGLNRLYGVKVMAIQRHGLQHRYQLRGMRVKGGDVLLLQADRRGLDALRETGAVLVVEQVGRLLVNRERAPVALAIFAAVVVMGALNVAPLVLLAVLGAGAAIAAQCVRPRDAVTALDAPVLFLIASAIPLGLGLEKTGLAAQVAHAAVAELGRFGPNVVLSGLYLFTMITTELVSNNATAVLMTPLALGVAATLGVDARPFLVAIMFAGSACFSTPIGYQTNLIVMGPGGYTFGDYFRFGLPLNLLLWVTASILVPVFFPIR